MASSDPVEALPVIDSDVDSSYDEEILSTTSIGSSIYAYEVEHGRTYHAYNAGKYVLPNDEMEQDRMDLQYHALRIAFSDKMFYAPIGDNPQYIMDIGTGTGIWVMDVGDAYPSAKVIGTDLSPIQPAFVPPNVQFEVQDCSEMPWSYGEDKADLIHTRLMNGMGIRDWDDFYKEAFRTLKPGGWVECQEFDLNVTTDDDSMPEGSAVIKWCRLMLEGSLKGGIDFRINSTQLRASMERAGFTNIQSKEFKLPIGLWPAEKELRESGKFSLVAMLEGLQGISLVIYTRLLGWSVEELEIFLAEVRKEWKSKKVHSYWPLTVVYGQKPAAA